MAIRLFVVVAFVLASLTPDIAVACSSVRWVRSRAVVVQRSVAFDQALIATPVVIPVQIPTYSVSYSQSQAVQAQQGDEYGSIVEELKNIRAELTALRGGQPGNGSTSLTMATVVANRCVKCHAASVATKAGRIVLQEDDGKSPPFSVQEKKLIKMALTTGFMPPKGEKPLTDAERKAVLDVIAK